MLIARLNHTRIRFLGQWYTEFHQIFASIQFLGDNIIRRNSCEIFDAARMVFFLFAIGKLEIIILIGSLLYDFV